MSPNAVRLFSMARYEEGYEEVVCIVNLSNSDYGLQEWLKTYRQTLFVLLITLSPCSSHTNMLHSLQTQLNVQTTAKKRETMANLLETPSRVWRRIQVDQDRDMPSLPSLPAFDDSADPQTILDQSSEDDMPIASPIHSTPAALSYASTIRAPSSTSSTARFAHSLAASRSVKSSMSVSRGSAPVPPPQASFDISAIPSLPGTRDPLEDMDIHSSDQETEGSSVPEAYLPPALDDNADPDFDLSDALQSISRSNSPVPGDRETPRRKSEYDYSISLRSEPQVCLELSM